MLLTKRKQHIDQMAKTICMVREGVPQICRKAASVADLHVLIQGSAPKSTPESCALPWTADRGTNCRSWHELQVAPRGCRLLSALD